MPPNPNRQQQGDTRRLQFLDIDDFTPGCYDASVLTASSPANTVPGPFPAPVGAADASQTWQCIALRNGGLGPMPANTLVKTLGDLGIETFPPSGQVGYIVGLLNTGITSDDEFVVCLEYFVPGSPGTNHAAAYSAVLATATANLIQGPATSTALGRIAGDAYPFATRVAASDPTTTVGQMCIAFPCNVDGSLNLYPDPAATTVFGVANISDAGYVAGTIFGHQNRIVVLRNFATSWPVTPSVWSNNDPINYTDPPNSETYPGTTPDVIFVAEEPYGYGAVGSISAGELFMVKTRGGGVVISGDINNPTVTYLPGVHPTGIQYGKTDSDLNGLYYCALDSGAWLWNGGNVANKISNQLDNNFYSCSNPIPNQNFAYFIHRWGELVLFSNNWVFDSLAGGWWRLLNPSTASFFWYTHGFAVNQLYAAVPKTTDVTSDVLYKFDRTVPASSWQWQSLPIRVAEDRYIDVREVQMRYSNPYGGTGTFTIQISAIDANNNLVNAQTFTWNSAVNRPTMQRLNIRAQAEDITIRVAAQANTAGQPAPVVHSLSIGYRTRQHAGTTE
jgi:hypothetical protein